MFSLKILKGWNVPGAPAKAIMSVGVGWGKIMNPPGGEIILRKVPPASWGGGGPTWVIVLPSTIFHRIPYNSQRHYQPPENNFRNYFGMREGGVTKVGEICQIKGQITCQIECQKNVASNVGINVK